MTENGKRWEEEAIRRDQKSMPGKKRVAIARLVVRWLFRLCGGLVIEGRKNVPTKGRVLICPNHISDCDPAAALAMLPRDDFAVIAKQELFQIPVLGRVMRGLGAFPIVRDSADRHALRLGEEILSAERALMIFPEGRLSQDGCLLRFQPGAALLALRTGAPIVPVGLIGTNRILPYGKVIPRLAGRPAIVRYGKPISMDEFAGVPHKAAREAVIERLVEEIAALTGQVAH